MDGFLNPFLLFISNDSFLAAQVRQKTVEVNFIDLMTSEFKHFFVEYNVGHLISESNPKISFKINVIQLLSNI